MERMKLDRERIAETIYRAGDSSYGRFVNDRPRKGIREWVRWTWDELPEQHRDVFLRQADSVIVSLTATGGADDD